MEEPPQKRRRLSVTSDTEYDVDAESRQSTPMHADEPTQLLQRSIAQALGHVGFDGASREALDAFCSEAEEYMLHFLSYVTESMHCSRRALPTPIDFAYALRRDGIDKISLEPHLKPPVAPITGQRELEEAAAEKVDAEIVKLLGQELSGRVDQLQKPYIPKKFPAFPARHTYKWTETTSVREIDPRKIREKATEAARYGEDALRRLVKASKTGGQKALRQAAKGTTIHRQRHELWTTTMKSLSAVKGFGALESEDRNGADENGTIVNAEKHYWRKGMAPTKGVVREVGRPE